MARTGWLIAAFVLVGESGGPAADLCDEGRAHSGLAVATRDEGLVVAAVDAESVAARAGMRVGDVIVQANGILPRSCPDFSRAVREARRVRKAILLLVRRATEEVPLVLGAAMWDVPEVTSAPAAAPVVSTRDDERDAPPLIPLPDEVPVSLDSVVSQVGTLAPDDGAPPPLPVYRRALADAGRALETLVRRALVDTPVARELREVLGYFRGAEVAWDTFEGTPERERRSRRLPVADAVTAPYFEDSVVAALLRQYPFLHGTIERQPAAALGGESSGLWRPVQARALLWAQGREALRRFRTRHLAARP